MKGKAKSLIWGMAAVFLLSGCANMSARQRSIWEGATMGAIIGGGGGAAYVASQDDDRSDRDKGAIIGMLAGGLIGGFLGAMRAPEEKPAAAPAPAPAAKVYEAPAPTPAPARVEAEPAAPSVAVVKERVVLRGINFDFDKSDIKPEFTPVLDEAARILKDRTDVREIVLEGHTCWVGTEKYNQGLSERRAKSVRDYLVGQGVSAERLTTIGYGETKPMADNKTLKGRQMNRRVEFKVMNE
ncbi:MAG: OmpA family protein [Desulfobulbaceae bacterium]|nr:OmpA family protein [Desulfobulbaceae bacterium]